MQKIIPHLWFDHEAKEAIEFYCQLFVNSKITSETTLPNTPSGTTEVFSFQLAGQDFTAMNAGPLFHFTPAISMFVVFETEEETEELWNKLAKDGKVLMAYAEYPFANKYGWIEDKFGLSWQLVWSEHVEVIQRITPALLFTGPIAGWAKEAIEDYVRIFPISKMELAVPYSRDDDDVEGFIKHARFTLSGQHFIAIDSSKANDFSFTEAISFILPCNNQEEIDYYWKELSAVPEAEQCGWLKDKYGVSWQIVPNEMFELLASGDTKRNKQLTQALLEMKKIDIKALKVAYTK